MKRLTKNCTIEHLKLEHYYAINALYSDVNVRAYLGGVPKESYIEASFRGMLEAPSPNTYLYISLKETDEFIGLVSIDEYHDSATRF